MTHERGTFRVSGSGFRVHGTRNSPLATRNGCAKRSGQSVLEYAILLAVAVAVIIAGQIYFKRGLQGRWKDASDQLGEQFTTNEKFTIEKRQQSSREEVKATGGATGEIANGNWTRSSILNTLPKVGTEPIVDIAQVGGQEKGYTGHETTRSDYVDQAVAAGKLGKHGSFDSGRISEKKLFEDD